MIPTKIFLKDIYLRIELCVPVSVLAAINDGQFYYHCHVAMSLLKFIEYVIQGHIFRNPNTYFMFISDYNGL
jgi:hypothetical protein